MSAHHQALFLSSQSPFPGPSHLVVPRKQEVLGPSAPDLFGGGSRNKKKPFLISSAQDLANSFDPKVDFLKGVNEFVDEIDRLKTGREPVFPVYAEWRNNYDWSLAVDAIGDQTCWTTRKPPRISDHFGLHFLHPRLISEVDLIGSSDLQHMLSAGDEDASGNSWSLQLQTNSSAESTVEEWLSVSVVVDAQPHDKDLFRIHLTLTQPRVAQKLRFISTDAKLTPLVLCDIQVE